MLKKIVNSRLLTTSTVRNKVPRVHFEELLVRHVDAVVKESLEKYNRIVINNVPGLKDHILELKKGATDVYDALSIEKLKL